MVKGRQNEYGSHMVHGVSASMDSPVCFKPQESISCKFMSQGSGIVRHFSDCFLQFAV